MDNLNKALGDISSIRRQLAQTTEFRGYGPVTVAGTAGLAVAASLLQRAWVPDPMHHAAAYLSVWSVTAILSAGLIGAEMYARTLRIHSGLADEMLRMAAQQFLPSAGVGAMVAVVLGWHAPTVSWMIPGLLQVIFSLGVFASCRFLPRAIAAVGAWYLLTGLICLGLGDARALSPWAMGIPYCAGQLLVAAILVSHAREVGDEA
jgi:hypothetical protein